jgi:hypothetical protein
MVATFAEVSARRIMLSDGDPYRRCPACRSPPGVKAVTAA